MRLTHGDVKRGTISFHPKSITTCVAAMRSKAEAEKPKINLREIFRVVQFSTFATISANR